MRALIIDDDASLAGIFSRCLSLWGWEHDISPTVAQALELFNQTSYDLALCDVDLPDGDGVLLARALKKARPDLLVVVASGRSDNIDRAREAGLGWCLHKPFSFDELKAVIDEQSRAVDSGRNGQHPGQRRS